MRWPLLLLCLSLCPILLIDGCLLIPLLGGLQELRSTLLQWHSDGACNVHVDVLFER